MPRDRAQMLAAIDVRLYPKQDCTLPHPCAHLLHAAVLDLVRIHDPGMSNDLHRDAQVKPFALSTLWSRSRASGDVLVVPKYTECGLRLCSLGRPVFEALSRPLFSMVASNGSICLNGSEFVLVDAGMESPYGGVSDFRELWIDGGTSAEILFTSPTTFRRRGLNVPLPDPQLVYGSLWQKWQAFSDVPVGEEVFDEMMSGLALSRARIHTETWKYPRFKLTGFLGRATFELVRPVSEDARRLFSALSGLSFYAGVGYRTTMGMGQCRLTDRGSALQEQAPPSENLNAR